VQICYLRKYEDTVSCKTTDTIGVQIKKMGESHGMIKKERCKKGTDIMFNIITYTVFTLLGLVFAYPFYYLFICTISDNMLVNLNDVILYPKGIHFQNYVDVLKLSKLQGAAIISAARTLLGTVLSVLFTAYAAYFFTKEHIWHRKLWYRLIVSTMYFSAGMVPVYLNIKLLGLMNTFWVYVMPSCLSIYNMILVKTSMEALPASLEESAEIDGAGYLTRFFHIVLPLSKPILATIALFTAVSQWNAVFDTKMYITNTKLYSLQFVLYEYYQQVKSLQETMAQTGASYLMNTASSQSLRLTMTAVTVIPVMCIYPFVQKYYLKGMLLGAVKG